MTAGRAALRARFGDVALTGAFALAAAGAVWVAAWLAPAVFLQLGPNMGVYLRGFRPGGWERDGATRYHWTTPSAWVQLPAHAAGDGFLLRARVRRHMVEPAQVTLSVEGQSVAVFPIAADTKIAYKEIEIRLPSLQGRRPFVVMMESSSQDTRPLGLAVDWLRLERGGTGRLRPLTSHALLFALVIAFGYALPRLTGVSLRWAALHSGALVLLGAALGAIDFLAFERIIRDGWMPYVFASLVAAGFAWWARRAGVSHDIAGLLCLLVLIALGLRLALLLHPRFFYPDMAIHGTVAYVLSKEGLPTFVQRFFETQFRFSLGLQFQAGHTYAFPYAPGLYVLAWPLISVMRLRPEVAVASIATVFNSLGLFVTFALGRRLLRSDRGALIAVSAHLALPLFFVRLTMAYFPSVTGHAIDAAALTLLLLLFDRPIRMRHWAILAVLLTVSLLTYSQAIVNFAMLFGLYLAWDFVRARTSDDRRRQIWMAGTVGLALLLALLLFYRRYVPVFLDMRHGMPMLEEEILLDKQRVERSYAESRGETLTPHVEVDAYSGPGFNPLRGLWRLLARLVIFYGPFVLTIVWGFSALIRSLDGTTYRYVAVWASLAFLVCFLAGALPAPNFLRYSKDLEASAPLFCVAFALATTALARRSRALAVVHVAGLIALGLWHGLRQWVAMFE